MFIFQHFLKVSVSLQLVFVATGLQVQQRNHSEEYLGPDSIPRIVQAADVSSPTALTVLEQRLSDRMGKHLEVIITYPGGGGKKAGEAWAAGCVRMMTGLKPEEWPREGFKQTCHDLGIADPAAGCLEGQTDLFAPLEQNTVTISEWCSSVWNFYDGIVTPRRAASAERISAGFSLRLAIEEKDTMALKNALYDAKASNFDGTDVVIGKDLLRTMNERLDSLSSATQTQSLESLRAALVEARSVGLNAGSLGATTAMIAMFESSKSFLDHAIDARDAEQLHVAVEAAQTVGLRDPAVSQGDALLAQLKESVRGLRLQLRLGAPKIDELDSQLATAGSLSLRASEVGEAQMVHDLLLNLQSANSAEAEAASRASEAETSAKEAHAEQHEALIETALAQESLKLAVAVEKSAQAALAVAEQSTAKLKKPASLLARQFRKGSGGQDREAPGVDIDVQRKEVLDVAEDSVTAAREDVRQASRARQEANFVAESAEREAILAEKKQKEALSIAIAADDAHKKAADQCLKMELHNFQQRLESQRKIQEKKVSTWKDQSEAIQSAAQDISGFETKAVDLQAALTDLIAKQAEERGKLNALQTVLDKETEEYVDDHDNLEHKLQRAQNRMNKTQHDVSAAETLMTRLLAEVKSTEVKMNQARSKFEFEIVKKLETNMKDRSAAQTELLEKVKVLRQAASTEKETATAYASLENQHSSMAVQIKSVEKELQYAKETLGRATDDAEKAGATAAAAEARAGEFLVSMDEQLTEFQLARAQRKKAIDEQQEFVLVQQKKVNAAEANVTEASVAADQAVAARERAAADLLKAKVQMSKKLAGLGAKADALGATCARANNLPQCREEEKALKTQIENAKAEEKATLADLKPKAAAAAEKSRPAAEYAKEAQKWLEAQREALLKAERDAMDAALAHEGKEDEFSTKLQGLQAELANAQKESDQARQTDLTTREELKGKQLEFKTLELKLPQIRKEQQSAAAEQEKTAVNLKIAKATVGSAKADADLSAAKLVKLADAGTQEMTHHSEEIQSLGKQLAAGVEDINKARVDIAMLVGRMQGAATKVGQITEQLALASVDFDKIKVYALQKLTVMEAGLEELRSSRKTKELELAKIQTTIAQAEQRLLETRLMYLEVSLNIQERSQITKGVEDGLANLMKV